MLMSVASDRRLLKHASILPPSWMTLHELSRLTDEQFDGLLADGVIRPDQFAALARSLG